MDKPKIGIIGGSGLEKIDGLQKLHLARIRTPFGPPADKYIIGNLAGKTIAFLPRHGKGHWLAPAGINFRANIWGFKKLGVERLIAVSAVGSMKPRIAPGDIVLIDQFFNHTKKRINSFFDNGLVGHISFANPVCKVLSDILYKTGRNIGCRVHKGGTYLCIEGPQFSTKAESNIYRKWGIDVIGMTNIPEASLAREAEICYATIALVTDYDCWKETESNVTVEIVVKRLKELVEKAKTIIKKAIPLIPDQRDCECSRALENTIITAPESISPQKRKDLEIIIGKYLTDDR